MLRLQYYDTYIQSPFIGEMLQLAIASRCIGQVHAVYDTIGRVLYGITPVHDCIPLIGKSKKRTGVMVVVVEEIE